MTSHDDGRAFVTDSQWPQPEAPRDTRWTDAEWAAEQVALARRQAEVARAEAREAMAWAERCENLATATFEEARTLRADASTSEDAWLKSIGEVVAERDQLRAIVESDRALAGEASEAWAVLTGGDPQSGRPVGSCVTEARRVVAELRAARTDLDEREADMHARIRAGYDKTVADAWRAKLAAMTVEADTWKASVGRQSSHIDSLEADLVEAHRAHRESCDAALRLEAELAEARAALEAARAAVHTPSPGGSDLATRTRALPVVPATCGECRHMRPHRDTTGKGSCLHPSIARFGNGVVLVTEAPPPAGCPIRTELAKAGGA